EQRNRLTDVERELQAAESVHAGAAAGWETLQQRLRDGADAEKQAREAQRLAFNRQSQAQTDVARLEQRAAAETSRLAALEEQAANLEKDREETARLLADVEGELQALPETSETETKVKRDRAELAEQRGLLAEADAEL